MKMKNHNYYNQDYTLPILYLTVMYLANYYLYKDDSEF